VKRVAELMLLERLNVIVAVGGRLAATTVIHAEGSGRSILRQLS